MPVKRKRETIAPKYQTSPVTNWNPGRSFMEAGNAAIRMSAEVSANFARAMAIESEDEAVRLAKLATFSMDENGVPQMPEETWGYMGDIARRTYDKHMEDKMLRHVQTAWQSQVAEAYNDPVNMINRDAFNAELQKRADTFRSTLPEAFHGAFQHLYNSASVEYNARIGHADAVQQRQDERDQMIAAGPRMVQTAIDMSRGGDMAAGDASLANYINEIRSTDTQNMSIEQQNRLIDQVTTGWSKHKLYTHLGWGEDVSSGELRAVAAELSKGENMDPALRTAFQVPGTDEYRGELGPKAQQLANMLIAEATAREKGIANGVKTAHSMGDMAAGVKGHSWTQDDKAAVDADIGMIFGKTDGSGMSQQDWFALSAQIDENGNLSPAAERTLRRAKQLSNGGKMAPSVVRALSAAWSARDQANGTEYIKAMIPIYEYFVRGSDERQAVNNTILDNLRPEQIEYYDMLMVLVDGGDNINNAVVKVNKLVDPESGMATTQRHAKLAEAIDNESMFKGAPAIDETNYKAEMEAYVRRTYETNDDRPLYDGEMKRAQQLFSSVLLETNDAEQAMSIVQEQIGREYVPGTVETQSSDPGWFWSADGQPIPMRREHAVNVQYPQPRAHTIWQMVSGRPAAGGFEDERGKVPRKDITNLGGLVFESVVDIAQIPIEIFTGDIMEFQSAIDGVDYGRQDMMTAYFDQEIRKLVRESPQDFVVDPVVNRLMKHETVLTPGEDFRAIYDRPESERRGHAVYMAQVKTPDGQWQFLRQGDGRTAYIDPSKVHKAEKKADEIYSVERALRKEQGLPEWTSAEIAARPAEYLLSHAIAAERAGYPEAARQLRQLAGNPK
jgi:hypothetical protein